MESEMAEIIIIKIYSRWHSTTVLPLLAGSSGIIFVRTSQMKKKKKRSGESKLPAECISNTHHPLGMKWRREGGTEVPIIIEILL